MLSNFILICYRVDFFFFLQLSVEGWVFMSADFWILESNDNNNTLQAIKHFSNFIPSNFMEGFAFLIDDTRKGCFT